MSTKKGADKSAVWISGPLGNDGKGTQFRRAVVREALGTLTEISVEFLCDQTDLPLKEFLAKQMTLHVATPGGEDRLFTGTVVSIEGLGLRKGLGHFVAELRPRLWMLTKTTDNRIFQQKSATAIIEEVLKENGLTRYRMATSESYKERDYCVQYRETDFDFIHRLMEEEGLYYYFDHAGSDGAGEMMVICDGSGGHGKVAGDSKLRFIARDNSEARRDDHIAEWGRQEQVTSGKVSLQDYDPMASGTDLAAMRKIEKGEHAHKTYELYSYPGRYGQKGDPGTARARIRMEAEAARFERRRGAGTIKGVGTGLTFSLDGGDVEVEKGEFLITDAVHYLQEEGGFEEVEIRRDLDPSRVRIPEGIHDTYASTFGAIPATVPFRLPPGTPWPEIAGLQTAKVVGPKGEEIHTDEFGRIKVQFHWDRLGKTDDKSSCWVRVATPWAGKSWGMVALPRIGQEVVIQFEEGNPDRPICTGMLYNDVNKAPFNFPDDATQSGIRTDSSKGGGGYNELMFEDKKDEELVRFQAERDYEQIVKNNATITIGLEKAEDGDLTQTVQNNVTETIKEGDHSLTIEKGDQTYEIKTGSQTLNIKSDRTVDIKGKQTRTIVGNDATTVKTGDVSVDAKAGKITMEAMQSIELKVGQNSITIDQSGIKINGMMVKIQGTASAEMKSPLTTVKADAMLVLKGGMTMIN